MKKRSLSLFLALLMVFGSVLPIFAVEPDTTPEQDEELDTGVQDVYADLYVKKNKLIYRWDAYGMEAYEGTELVMADKDGREVSLTLTNAPYNATYGIPETTKPIDFSSLITRTEGVYDQTELEFELVMTQTHYSGTESTNNRPYILFGPTGTIGSGALMSAENAAKVTAGKEPVHTNIPSYGGYEAYYFGMRADNSNSIKNFIYYYDAEKNLIGSSVVKSASVTEYYDATNTKVASLDVSGAAYTVTIPHVVGTTGAQICTQDWGSFKRYFGNPVGESYSVGAQIDFDAANSHMNLKLYRDAMACPSGTFSNISYVPGYAANGDTSGTGTRIIPASYEDALAMAERNGVQNNTGYPEDKGEFKIGGSFSDNVKVGYYAFRLYSEKLTDAERQQNHFADLCTYYQIDPASVEAYKAMSAESKMAIAAAFSGAVIDSRAEVSNTSFEDVSKEQIEKAIVDQVAAEEEIQKINVFYKMYVEGSSLNWMAYHADAKALAGTTALKTEQSGSVLSVTPNASGSAAFGDGYLRVIDGNLKATDVYAGAPEYGSASYTTEMIYATVDANRTRTYTGEAKFTTEYGPIFGQKIVNTFNVWGINEALTYTDAAGKEMQEAWGSAYLAAENDPAKQATFWTPISEADYNSMLAIPEQAANVRKNNAEIPAVGTYSKTGYEANWEGFQYVLTTLGRKNFYHGYNYASSNKPGIGNSYIMKSDINLNPNAWLNNPDFDNWGPEKGSWSRYDFGVVTSHTWTETITNNSGSYDYLYANYGDDVQVSTKSATGKASLTLSSEFKANSFDADYYAIRIYPFLLNEEQKAQNHFADLANYVKIENVESFNELSAEGKKAIYTQFAATTFANADKTAIESAIDTTLAKEKAFAELGVTAEDFFAFEGYQFTIWSAPAMRVTFSLKDPAIEGVTIKEIGMGMAFGGGDPMITPVYNGIEYTNTRTEGENTYASLAIPFASPAEQSKIALEAEFSFSGYVVISYQGIDFRMECDMTSDTFGEGVSMYELACHEALKDLDNAVLIRSIVEAE